MIYALLYISLSTLTPNTGQDQTAPSITQTPSMALTCDAHPAARDFDFWIGDWDVSNWETGTHAGTNSIQGVEKGCALLERWEGASGSSGISLNFYDAVAKEWRQLWFSAGSGGYSVDIRGALNDDGAMAMSGTITYFARQQTLAFRGLWTPQADGSVRQTFEERDPMTGDWRTWFDGRYTPKPPDTVD